MMEIIELLKKKITKQKITKNDFFSSINCLYSVHKLTIEEKENNIPTILKLLDILEKEDCYWKNAKINKNKTTCYYDKETNTYKIDIYINKENKTLDEIPVLITVKNDTNCYSDVSCEDFINIFNYAFEGNTDKNIIASIKEKIKR